MTDREKLLISRLLHRMTRCIKFHCLAAFACGAVGLALVACAILNYKQHWKLAALLAALAMVNGLLCWFHAARLEKYLYATEQLHEAADTKSETKFDAALDQVMACFRDLQ